MKSRAFGFVLVLSCALATPLLLADPPAPPSPKQALRPFNDLIGSWRGTGTPSGARDEQRDKFWTETIAWEWQFKGQDAWLKVVFDKSKHFADGELRPAPEKDQFVLTLRTPDKKTLAFAGKLQGRVLTLEREEQGEKHRLIFTLLHPNRHLYRYEVAPAGKMLFARKYQVGATKEGVPFAGGDGKPECIVSGGLGTTAVMFQGKTYYVCCSGCRTEFNENPEKYVREYEAKKKSGQ